MIEFFMSFVTLLAIVAGMAIGVMKGRAPISGTCGGLNNIGIDGACEICGGNPAKCESNEEAQSSGRSTGFYDASN